MNSMFELAWPKSAHKAVGPEMESRSRESGAVQPPEALPVRTWCEDGWLRLDSPLSAETGRRFERLLHLNADLPGPAKFCLSSAGETRLRAEVPMDTESALNPDPLSHAIASLHGAMSLLSQTLPADGAIVIEAEICMEPLPVKECCAEAGWHCIERGPRHWMVELDGTPSFCQTEVRAYENETHLTAPLGEWVALPACCEEAITLFLLKASGTFRMVRAAAVNRGGTRNALLTVRIPEESLILDLPHALSAMSVGMRRMQHEIRALQQPAIAGIYLAAIQALPSRQRHRRQNNECEHA